MWWAPGLQWLCYFSSTQCPSVCSVSCKNRLWRFPRMGPAATRKELRHVAMEAPTERCRTVDCYLVGQETWRRVSEERGLTSMQSTTADTRGHVWCAEYMWCAVTGPDIWTSAAEPDLSLRSEKSLMKGDYLHRPWLQTAWLAEKQIRDPPTVPSATVPSDRVVTRTSLQDFLQRSIEATWR